MTDLEVARRKFEAAGLAFPRVPEVLAALLEEKAEWLFSTRETEIGHPEYLHPYWLRAYVAECAGGKVADYVVLAHGGHGVNSYAIQYYLVYENLHLFLHLGWGGGYTDSQQSTIQIAECFALADEIVAAVEIGPHTNDMTLTIVGSDFYGSYWSVDGSVGLDDAMEFTLPAAVLREALAWLRDRSS